eukprot:CAMPEP_0180366200 /NCGR_PEP_ID=MMETSP0989-20121125/15933_1 /TAXON_ID=697907 /ORGANISM="non described non described, Strain CCMP2293" /LENGTH=86 /DNA_ID=CAMNT_0022359689 /DNA_START=85 /DNA_END=344 /DNA_ORIENTATION=-
MMFSPRDQLTAGGSRSGVRAATIARVDGARGRHVQSAVEVVARALAVELARGRGDVALRTAGAGGGDEVSEDLEILESPVEVVARA